MVFRAPKVSGSFEKRAPGSYVRTGLTDFQRHENKAITDSYYSKGRPLIYDQKFKSRRNAITNSLLRTPFIMNTKWLSRGPLICAIVSVSMNAT